ncbi:MAG: long-chain fatty acid--CoA ligase [Myxococcales bacterium]|nr:long-chain fatty acid--CoA ligase [Myxococcales bacterium]
MKSPESLNLATILRESATKHPHKPALIIGETQLPYAHVHSAAQRFASALIELGVKPGQHVALMLPNVPHFTIAYFACHYAAAPVVPLNVLLTAEEIAYHLADSDAVAIVVWEGFYQQAKAGFDRARSCKHMIVARADPQHTTAPDALNMASLIGANDPLQDVPATKPDDTAVLLYTSGTTGKPKGAELTHANMFGNAEYVASRLLPLGSDTVALTVLPLFHSFGQTVMHNAVLLGGGTVVLQPRFEPEPVLKLMQDRKVTLFAGVPTMYFGLLHYPDADKYDLSSLEYCVSGGAAMPVEVMRAFDEKYNVNILEGYGLSETSPVASFNHLDRPKKAGSIGTPIGGVDFRLVDEYDREIRENDKPGEICIRGPNVMKGYYRRIDATREAIRDGWFHSGDIATRDDDGFYFIVDRKKDMIIRGGFNVYPREIEEVLYAHPAVAEAAVIGVPHAKMGEEVKAVIAFKPGQRATEEELTAHCREKLASYKNPRIYEFVDALPKGPTGKILKRELRG